MKALIQTVAALGLALATAVGAQAAPVSFSFSDDSIQSDGVSAAVVDDHFGFTLTGLTQLSGSLSTGPDGGSGPWVDITSAYLQAKSGGTIYHLTETKAVNWADDEFGVETWTLGATWLAAGDWVLSVIGEGYNDKSPDGFGATLAGRSTELPEPAMLALTFAALAGLRLSRRAR